MKLNTLNLYTTEHYEDYPLSVDFKKEGTLQKVTLMILFALVFVINISSVSAAADDVFGTEEIEPSIDCSWDGNYFNCTITEPHGVGSVLLHRLVDGEPWFSLLEYPGCPKTVNFEGHADGPASLLIDVSPCGNSPYVYIPMEADSATKRMKILKTPNEKSVVQSIEGLLEENKRLRKFIDIQKKERGVVKEN